MLPYSENLSSSRFRHQKNAQNAQRSRNRPGIMLLPRVSCLFGGPMSWCWVKPASAVSTVWGYSPRHGGGGSPCRRFRLSTPPYVAAIKTWHTRNGEHSGRTGRVPGRLIKLEQHKPFVIHSYEKRARKPFGIHSYAIIGLKVPWNKHLTKNRGWGGPRVCANQDTIVLGQMNCQVRGSERNLSRLGRELRHRSFRA